MGFSLNNARDVCAKVSFSLLVALAPVNVPTAQTAPKPIITPYVGERCTLICNKSDLWEVVCVHRDLKLIERVEFSVHACGTRV
jgi:hypothetical protein